MAVVNQELKPLKRIKIQHIISLMRPCMFLCRLYGLFPYHYEVTTMVIALSKPWYIISCIMMTIYVGYGIVILYQAHVSKVLMYDNVPGMLQGNCYIIICNFIGVITLILSASRVSFLQELFKISTNVPSKAFQKIGKFIYIKDIFGFIFLIGQIPNIYNKNIYFSLYKTYGLYATLVVFLTDALYMDFVVVLLLCFKNINDNLIELKRNILAEESKLLVRIFPGRKNPIAVLKLRTIKKMHQSVSDILEKLNITFSFQIMASITLTFAEVTFSLYFYLLHIREEKSINLERQIWYSYFITSITYHCTKLVGIIWACQLTKDEAIRTGILVHEILINTEETQLKEELQLFSLQILQRDNTFKAKGITLDASLITTIVGGITTYLLILIQFLISAKQCENQLIEKPSESI